MFKIDFLKVILLIYVFLTVLGLHFCSGFSLVVVSGDYSLLVVPWCSLVAEHGL